MSLRRPQLTYANVIATIALFLALGGAAFAASQLPKNSVGSKQLKKNAVTTAKVKNGAITGAKIDLSSLGTVPSATHATTSDSAAKATSAESANHADSATSAGNSAQLGGKDPASYVQRIAQSGETLTGQIASHFEPGGEFWLAGDSYRSPLPASAPVPNLVFLPESEETAPGCPGIGSADPGVLCVYAYNTQNLQIAEESGDFGEANYRYGFALDLFPVTEGSEAYLLGSWAYQVP